HIRKHLCPSRSLIAARPSEDEDQQAHAKRCRTSDDLISCQAGNKGSDRQQSGGLQKQAEVTHRQRLPVGIAVLEDKRSVEAGQQEHPGIEPYGCEPFSNDHLKVTDGRSYEQFNGAVSLFFGKQAHGNDRYEEESHHVHIGEESADDLLIDVHGHHLAAHWGAHAVKDESAQHVPEKPAKDQGKHDQENVGNRRYEIAAQFSSANDPDVSHRPPSLSWASAAAGAGSSPVS